MTLKACCSCYSGVVLSRSMSRKYLLTRGRGPNCRLRFRCNNKNFEFRWLDPGPGLSPYLLRGKFFSLRLSKSCSKTWFSPLLLYEILVTFFLRERSNFFEITIESRISLLLHIDLHIRIYICMYVFVGLFEISTKAVINRHNWISSKLVNNV